VHARWSTLSVALLTAGAMLACGSGPLSGVSSYRGKTQAPPSHDPTTLHGAYVVAPDRTLSAVSVTARSPDAQQAADQVRDDWKALEVAVSDLPHCALRAERYRSPLPADGGFWTELSGTLDADLTGATDVMERMARIDACRGPVLAQMTFDEVAVDGTERHRKSTIGEAVVVVDEPTGHLGALLARHSTRLAAVSVPSAPQLHPDDLRCAPRGTVTVGTRSVGGVVLTLDVDCRVVPTPTDTPEG